MKEKFLNCLFCFINSLLVSICQILISFIIILDIRSCYSSNFFHPQVVVLFFLHIIFQNQATNENTHTYTPTCTHNTHTHTICFNEDIHPSGCEVVVVSHCGFELHCLKNWWQWAYFHVLFDHLYMFFKDLSNALLISYNLIICIFVFELCLRFLRV